AGAGYFAVTLHWIVEPFLVDAATHGWMAPGALVLLSGGLALFWAAAGWGTVKLGTSRWLAWALLLSAAEILRGHIFTGFPWGLPAYIWAETPVRMVASLVGSFGLTLITLTATALTATEVVKRGIIRGVATGLIATVVLFGLGWGLGGPDEFSDRQVRLIQPNAKQSEKWDPDKAITFVRRQIEYTGENADNVDLMIWPETAIPYRLDGAQPVLDRIAEEAGGIPVVTGINRTDGENWFNSLIVVGPAGAVEQTFDKQHLVPFGEYIPFRLDFLRAMAARSDYGFASGQHARRISTPFGDAIPLICYEVIFPRHSRSVETRPAFLMQITNDAWFGNFSGPFQHLNQARFRAVEQGLPLVRAANTGVSAIITPNGTVSAKLDLNTAGYLDAPMPLASQATIYARIGDLPVFVVVVLGLVFQIAVARRKGIAKRDPNQ
ncbi:MAG: apolipoprotein N-acyltransferase, partial [Boseongicola sp.]|nr:apolipoprotein N-acyltransferase [Boseongicola sp.]